jgi:uncharacterized protein (TIGR02996 family)
MKEDDLLDAVWRFPAENTPRLMYADWLDERGGEENADHALYIRNAVELAGLTPCGHHWDDTITTPVAGCACCRCIDVNEEFENRALVSSRKWRPKQWLTVGPNLSIKTATYWHRGFIRTVNTSLSLATFMANSDDVFVHPVELVHLTNKYAHNSVSHPRQSQYTWLRHGDPQTTPWVVPKALWLKDIFDKPANTFEDARKQFSDALIRWGRKKFDDNRKKRNKR